MRHLTPCALALAAGSLLAVPAGAARLNLELTNLTHGSYFTPLLIAAHGSGADVFEVGTSASANLRAMAEGGDISGIQTALGGLGADQANDPVGGVLAPGLSTSASLDTDVSGNDRISIVAMILPSNDGFVGLDSLPVPTQTGTYTYYLNAYDAATEANDERVTGGGAPGAPGIPADPGAAQGTNGSGASGADTNTTVHVHRGVLGDTDANGGRSDLDSRVHRWLNPVARLVLTVN